MNGFKRVRSYGANRVDEIDQKRRNQANFDWQNAFNTLADKVRDSNGPVDTAPDLILRGVKL